MAGHDDAHVADDRLEDHAGDLRSVFGKGLLEAGRVVVGQHERVAAGACRDAGRIGHGQCGGRAAGRHQ